MNYEKIDANIRKAEQAAIWCAKNGIGYFCPHLNSAHFEVKTPFVSESFWREMDLEILQFCGAILLVAGWSRSTGALAEWTAMNKLDRPSFEFEFEEDRRRLAELVASSKMQALR